MIRQKRPTQQYKLLQKEYDDVYKDIMLNGYDFSGPYTEKCEAKLKEITGRKHMYMTISGTGAITAAIYALDLFDKKVAVSSWNYSACVNQYKAFSKPVFVDCDDNFFIDIDKIPNDCDAVMLVNYFGNIVDYDRLASKFKGKVVADCSQALGATYKGRTDGYFGDVSTFAFGGQKPLGTRGFTGAIGTDCDDLAHRIDCVINQGKAGENRNNKTEMLGFRGTPQELQCGMLYVGLKYYKEWQEKRKQIATKIMDQLSDCPMRFIKTNYCESGYFKLPFELDNRDKFIDFMRDEGVDAQVTFIDDWNVIFGDGKPMANTQKMITRTASLPLSPFFSEAEVDTIISAVKKFYKQG